jgi:hypothetical protein
MCQKYHGSACKYSLKPPSGGFFRLNKTYSSKNICDLPPAMTGFMSGVAGLMGDEAIKLFINRFKRGLS